MSAPDDELRRNMRKIFNLNRFVNSKQKDAVETILKRQQDVLISMPSGSRKSLCFQLPGVMDTKRITVVCSPSTATIKNQIHYLKKHKIGATSIISTLSDEERKRITKDAISEKPEIRFIYVTPEQACTDSFTNLFQSLNDSDRLAYVAVDDAHCASQETQDFRHEYIKFGSLRSACPAIPWIALTHNASPNVLSDIAENLQLKEPIAKFKKSSFRKNLYYDIIFKNTTLDPFIHLKKYVASCLVNDEDDDGVSNKKKPCGIIYCKDRESVDLVTKKLRVEGISTRAHHGGIASKERKRVEDDWIDGKIPVITATTSFSAGMDKNPVRFVVHWDVPQSVVNYYKESGMAGRDGKSSNCRIYYSKQDVMAIDSRLKNDIEKSKDENGKRKALRTHADFIKLTEVCETVSCRHQMFSKYFDDTAPNCTDKCDVCTDPAEAEVALNLFYHLNKPPASRNSVECPETLTLNAPIIKPEPRSPNHENFGGVQSHQANGQSTTPNSFRPRRDVSPTNTIIKEEDGPCDSAAPNRIGHSNLSDELFRMQAQPPGNVSPARTLVKEELNESPNAPPRCVSPAETVIEEKPVIHPSGDFSMHTSPDSQRSIRSGDVVIKSEPKSPVRAVDEAAAIIDPIASAVTISDTDSGAPSTDIVTNIKREATIVPTAHPRASTRKFRTPSPSGTEIKDECLSPDRNMDIDADFLDDLFDDSPDRDDMNDAAAGTNKDPERCQGNERGSETDRILIDEPQLRFERKESHMAASKSPPVKSRSSDVESDRSNSFKRDRRRSSDYSTINDRKNSARRLDTNESYRLKRENGVRCRRRSRSRSVSRRRNRSRSVSRRRSRSRSVSRRRSRSRSVSRRRSRSRSVSRRRNRSRSVSRRKSRSRSGEWLKRENDTRSKRRSRSRSVEKLKRENIVDRKRKPSSPSSSYSRRSDRDSHKRRRQRRSNESWSEVDDRYYSIQPSTSNGQHSSAEPSSKSIERIQQVEVGMRFSTSPDTCQTHTQYDSDVEYGWMDPAPPKAKYDPDLKPTVDDPSFQEKINEFKNKLNTEYDLDKIKDAKKELFEAIEESIAVNAKKKLTQLDEQIQKKNNDYINKLFGTDNFDAWDDDPALSNVETVKKLKPFKSHIPDNIPLLDKMSMKHVINAMKLTPARYGNELVFHGYIKEIENEFQGQEMPPHLMESIKTEKTIIADLVKDSLKPYYNDGRIQPKDVFYGVARKISHIFYGRLADKRIIREYIDDLFKKVGTVTATTNLSL